MCSAVYLLYGGGRYRDQRGHDYRLDAGIVN
jgi:hypothetical protein